MKKDSVKTRSYYEINTGKQNKFKVAVLFFSLLLFMFLPFILLLLARYIFKIKGIDEPVAKIMLYFGFILICGINTGVIFRLADHRIKIKPFDLYIKEKYYLRIPDAYKYVDIVTPEVGDVMDELYVNGALLLKDKVDDAYLGYVYNMLNDNYDISGKRMTVYRITPKVFLEHFVFYEKDLYTKGDIYVIPVSLLGIDKNEYEAMKKEAGETFRILCFSDFADVVEGVCFHRTVTYRYRDAARAFVISKKRW